MSGPIKVYPTTAASVGAGLTVTGSSVANKVGLDVVIVGGVVSGTFAPSGLTVAGKITKVALTAAAWTALPAVPQVNRNSIGIQNQSGNGNVILLNYSAAAPATDGWSVEDGGFATRAIKDSIIIYGRMLAGAGVALIEELA